jgi:tol-pal system protein YbgF
MHRLRVVTRAALLCAVVQVASPAVAQDAAELLVRLDRLESLVRQLNGQVEQAQNENRRLAEQVRRFQNDTDFRFREIEGGRGGARAAPPAASPADAPARRQQRGDAFDPDANPAAPGAPQSLGATASSGPPPRQAVRQVPIGPVARPGEIIAGEDNALGRDPRGPVPLDPAQRGPQSASLPPAAGSAGDLALGRQQLTSGDYDAAEQTFRDFIRTRPRDRQIAEAVMGLGDSFFQRQRWREAAEQFVDLTTKYPRSARAAEAELKLGISLRGLGATREACDVLANHARKYPAASQAIRAGVQREQQRARCNQG